MKRLIMKFSFLTLMSLALFAMPIIAADGTGTGNGNGNGNGKEGCTVKCIKSTAMCKDQCKDGTPITDMLCRTFCDINYAGCMLFCPIAG